MKKKYISQANYRDYLKDPWIKPSHFYDGRYDPPRSYHSRPYDDPAASAMEFYYRRKHVSMGKRSYADGGILPSYAPSSALVVLEALRGSCPYCEGTLEVTDEMRPDEEMVIVKWTCVPCDRYVTQGIARDMLSYLDGRSYMDIMKLLEYLCMDVRKAFLNEPEFEGWAVGLDD